MKAKKAAVEEQVEARGDVELVQDVPEKKSLATDVKEMNREDSSSSVTRSISIGS